MEKIPIVAENGLQKLAYDYQEQDSKTHAVSSGPFGDLAAKLEEGSRQMEVVTAGFVMSMGAAAGNTKLVAVHKNTNYGWTCRARVETFRVVRKAVAEKRGGKANNRYAWYGGSMEEIRNILLRGFCVKENGASVVELAPFGCVSSLDAAALSSCHVDQDGVRHLLLCRVIIGKTAVVSSTGSNRVIPNQADSGVDKLINPRRYFVSTAFMNSHIYPEFVVSFKAHSCLDELKWGVVKTFKPTDRELVRYLYTKIFQSNGKEAFPELEIYGESGMEPWEIWRVCQADKFPHQDYIYFYSRLKKLCKDGSRLARRVGDGGTWSATEPPKPIYLQDNHDKQLTAPIAKLRKFRYEHKNKKFKQHAEWLMDEYTLEHSSSGLVLCRIKMNDGNKGRKRNRIAEENEDSGSRKAKSLKHPNMESPDSGASLNLNLCL